MIFERCVRPRHAKPAFEAPTVVGSGPQFAAPAAMASGPQLVQLFNAKLVTSDDGLVDGDLWMLGSTIVNPRSHFWDRTHAKAADRRVDCQGMLLAPGMIDIMLYSAFGINFSQCGEAGAAAEAKVAADFAMVRRRLPELGVTSFCPAVRACAPDVCARTIERLAKTALPPPPTGDGPRPDDEGTWAQCLGVHLDGPFLSAEHAASAGAPLEFVLASLEGAALDQACGGEATRAALMTLAPELPGALTARIFFVVMFVCSRMV